MLIPARLVNLRENDELGNTALEESAQLSFRGDIKKATSISETADQETASEVVPDLSIIQNLEARREHYQAGVLDDDAIKKVHQLKEEADCLRATQPDDSLIYSLRQLLQKLRIQNTDVEIPELKEGGSICEIGGPSKGAMQDDIRYAGAEQIVVTNPFPKSIDHFPSLEKYFRELAEYDEELLETFPVALKAIQEELPAEELTALSKRHGKFDYITSYHVFGQENIAEFEAYHPGLGADLRTWDKTEHLLGSVVILGSFG